VSARIHLRLPHSLRGYPGVRSCRDHAVDILPSPARIPRFSRRSLVVSSRRFVTADRERAQLGYIIARQKTRRPLILMNNVRARRGISRKISNAVNPVGVPLQRERERERERVRRRAKVFHFGSVRAGWTIYKRSSSTGRSPSSCAESNDRNVEGGGRGRESANWKRGGEPVSRDKKNPVRGRGASSLETREIRHRRGGGRVRGGSRIVKPEDDPAGRRSRPEEPNDVLQRTTFSSCKD